MPPPITIDLTQYVNIDLNLTDKTYFYGEIALSSALKALVYQPFMDKTGYMLGNIVIKISYSYAGIESNLASLFGVWELNNENVKILRGVWSSSVLNTDNTPNSLNSYGMGSIGIIVPPSLPSSQHRFGVTITPFLTPSN